MHKSRKNHGAFSATSKNHNSRRHTLNSPKSPNFTSGEREALQVFNQVLANKNRILKRDSDTFYVKKTVKTLKFDANGNEIIEKFEATTFGGFASNGEKVGEVVQQYCNEKTGTEKTSLQRILGNKLRRIEVKKTVEFESMNEYSENFDSEFDREWRVSAKDLGVKRIIGFENKVNTLSPKKNLL
jgi:hypothetical protein